MGANGSTGEDREGAGPLSAYRLPPGRHGIPPEQVVENQRWRLLGAAGEALAERGYAATKSADIARLAHVSRGTFYEHFENVADCLLAAYEMAADCVLDIVEESCEGRREWTVRLRAAIDEVLDFLASEPALANLLGPDVWTGIAEIGAARRHLVERVAALLRSGRKRHAPASESPAGTELLLVEGAFGLIASRVTAGEAERLPELAPELEELFAGYSPISSMR